MAKRVFEVTVIGTFQLELDDKVIAAVDDDWRKTMYGHINTSVQIAQYIGFNMIVNDCLLSDVDGFANLSDDLAGMMPRSLNWDTEATEVIPVERKKRSSK